MLSLVLIAIYENFALKDLLVPMSIKMLLSDPFLWTRKQRIYHNIEQIFYQARNQS
jgi:hypothetical protein